MTRMRTTIVALAVAATASLALAQNADKNTAGPTKNDYRLKIVEPREGATVDGGVVRVVVDTRIPAEIGTEKRDVNSMPRPQVDVFLDNTNKGTLREEQNVIEVDGVNAGAHKLVLVAKNQSGEIIDRQEVNFTANSTVATSTTTGSSATDRKLVGGEVGSTTPATGAWNAPKDNDQAMKSQSSSSTTSSGSSTYTAPSTSSSTTQSTPPSTTSPSTSTYQSPSTSTTTRTSPSTSTTTDMSSSRTNTASRTLPHTATPDGLVAITGLGLLAAGFALRRRQA